MSTSLGHALRQLHSFTSNWDGYGAEPINAAVVDSARRFVSGLPDDIVPTPQVVPMTRGRLQLEWHRGNSSLELEFDSPGTVHYLKWDSDLGIEEEDLLPLSRQGDILNLLRWFSAE